MKIYFAGKIYPKDDWRQSFFGTEENGNTPNSWGFHNSKISPIVGYNGLFYNGPFFDGLGHGFVGECHGIDIKIHDEPHNAEGTLFDIFHADMNLIRQSDCLFVWIDNPEETTAYGTLFEMGVAYQSQKPIYMGFKGDESAGYPRQQHPLWFVMEAGSWHFTQTAADAFHHFFSSYQTSPITFVRPHFRSLPTLHQPSPMAYSLASHYGFHLEDGYQPCVFCGDMTPRERIEINGECRSCFISH